ncbi:MAG: hypothetical protein JSW20_12500 [Nitrospiraceae bacterium]|nr:MAG: hypothetical protein JSW20_12500 [Nitrospiraceae bacterium]
MEAFMYDIQGVILSNAGSLKTASKTDVQVMSAQISDAGRSRARSAAEKFRGYLQKNSETAVNAKSISTHLKIRLITLEKALII